MPKHLNYRPILIDELITQHRIGSYLNVFAHSSDYELVGAYLWNTRVCAAISPLLTAAEVTLRNSIDNALSTGGYFWWRKGHLKYRSFVPNNPPPQVVSNLQKNFERASQYVKREKKNRYGVPNYQPSHQEIIANTDFSTWEFILDNEFLGPSLIWPMYLGQVLRGVWPSTKTKNVLTHTKKLVKTVREFRNRVAHHEPVWKKYGVNNETDAIQHLQDRIESIRKLISIISPEKDELLMQSGLYSTARRICSLSELRQSQHNTQVHNVKSLSKLSKLASEALTDNRSHKIKIYQGRTKKEIVITPT